MRPVLFLTFLILASLIVLGCESSSANSGGKEHSSGEGSQQQPKPTVGSARKAPDETVSATQSAESHPQAPPPKNPSSLFTNDVPGAAGHTCVKVNSLFGATGRSGAIRSGDFVAGNFPLYVREWSPNTENTKIWWQPLHTDKMPGLTVRATLLDNPSISRTYRFSRVGYAGDAFYPSHDPLPRSGTWRLVATAGPDWGCFEVEVSG